MAKVNSEKKSSDGGKHAVEDSTGDTDLFNFLRQMHLTGGANGMTVKFKDSGHGEILLPAEAAATTVQILTSRKRKAWEGIHSGNNKWVGGQRPPPLRSAESDEEHLLTPNCSNTGYDDTNGNLDVEEEHDEEQPGDHGEHGWEEEHQSQTQVDGKHHHLLSPRNLLNCEDIDTDLAVDFEGSFTGLGVELNTQNYSMSDQLLTINNIAVQQQLKEEASNGSSKVAHLKSEPQFMFSNYGALDLSNDDAQHPDSEQTPSPGARNPPTFSGSVSRENSQEAGLNNIESPAHQQTQKRASSIIRSTCVTSNASDQNFRVPSNHQSVILSYVKQDGNQQGGYRIVSAGSSTAGPTTSQAVHQASAKSEPGQGSSQATGAGGDHVPAVAAEEEESRFQYILAAPTSIQTKPGDPSLTYINQGQSYEIKIKKLGDISGHYKKKWLRSTIRICFHERRLQYIEQEQIAEWSRSHPNERILEIDMPLSYGIADVKQDSSNLSCVSFLWDPTRETGIFIKVHCISTEFTPKKHGGERGVPFRLQIETFNSDGSNSRLHAGACILQVFKLKGADRKHKQDREKISKRPDKFSPQYECTVLADLSVDNIYIPNSRGVSPAQSDNEVGGTNTTLPSGLTSYNSSQSSGSSSVISINSAANIVSNGKEESPIRTLVSPSGIAPVVSTGQPPGDSKTWKKILPQNAPVDTTAGWLAYNRYGQYVKTFNNFDARDLLRLSKDELSQMIGLTDGIRLHNDLHMLPVSPRLTLYLARLHDQLFHPVLLQEVTLAELSNKIVEIAELATNSISRIVLEGPNKIVIKLTDELLRHQPTDSCFYFSLTHEAEKYSVKLHKVSTS